MPNDQIAAKTSLRSPFDTEHLKNDLKGRSVRGGAITVGSQIALFGVHLASTVVLARLLTPKDYGVVAMVLAVTAFAGLFKEMGLSAATIQRDTLTDAQVSTMFWLNVLMGTVLTLTLIALAPGLVWFYQKPEVFWVTVALSTTFLFSSLGIQHSALLNRSLRYSALAVVHIGGAVATLVISIGAALAGVGYWALVWGTLVGSLVNTTLLWLYSGWKPGSPQWGAGVGGLLRYGANITGFDVVNYFSRNLDNLLIGRVWGPVALGLYSRAYALMMFPITNLRGPLNAVAFPAMSRLQNDSVRYRNYYRRLASLLAFTSMPIAAFLFATTDEIILLSLGRSWFEVSEIFRVLAITAFLQPTAGLRGLVLLSSGQARRYFWLGTWTATFTVVAFCIGVFWGPVGVAVAYGIVNYTILYPSLRYAFKGTPIKIRDFFSSVAKAAVASTAAGLFVIVVKSHTPWSHEGYALLASAAMLLLVYLLVFGALPGGMRELRQILSYRRFLLMGRSGSTQAPSRRN